MRFKSFLSEEKIHWNQSNLDALRLLGFNQKIRVKYLKQLPSGRMVHADNVGHFYRNRIGGSESILLYPHLRGDEVIIIKVSDIESVTFDGSVDNLVKGLLDRLKRYARDLGGLYGNHISYEAIVKVAKVIGIPLDQHPDLKSVIDYIFKRSS